MFNEKITKIIVDGLDEEELLTEILNALRLARRQLTEPESYAEFHAGLAAKQLCYCEELFRAYRKKRFGDETVVNL